MQIDPITEAWIRNESDQKAVANGCRFVDAVYDDAGDLVGGGAFAVHWIESYCKLYQGEQAGQPLVLHGCLDCAYNLEGIDPKGRARRHCECVRAGHAVDWQYEAVMRLFGWVRWSKQWKRKIRRFRQASIWVAKKNKKSPTLAAIGLYLLCGDDEPGQCVFIAAKDGTQAREVAGKHVIEMLLQCPALDENQGGECSVNKSTMQVTHLPSRSILRPLSSSNSRTQESKEGLNGSVIVDECHVVDREFIGRISRAGISRSEPLQIEVSTAGDNQDGYGKERFDKARSVIDGTIEDQDFFAMVYAAPPDLSDADLDADPLKWGRVANPAMGHTVDPEEYLKDYATSKATSISEFLRFKQYRLNIWSQSSNPWLQEGDWKACCESYTEADMDGLECVAGLDLSRVWDMSAFVLCFPWADGEFRLLPYFWLPREVAEQKRDAAPFLGWEKAGVLELTPGNDIDFGFIKAKIRKLAKRFKIKELRYDPKYANELTQSLEQGQTDDKGKIIEESAGIPRSPFAQSMMNFTATTKDFQRLIQARKLHHNGHPILTWQAGHVQVTRDANDNIRPTKPHDGIKKIDGIVAAIMALSGVTAQPKPKPGACYESGNFNWLA